MGGRLPIGVVVGTIGVTPGWVVEAARRLEAAGYAGIWCWDHFVSRGRRTDPVLEAWTTLTLVATATERVTVGSFVLNVMHRHPAVLARMAATLQQASGGRLVLGLGIGGSAGEDRAYGIEFPEAPERAALLEEAIAVLRALWSGGPVTRPSPHYPLAGAVAFPRPEPSPPILVGARTPAGVRLAARVADGWAAEADVFDALEPRYRDALAAAGRDRPGVRVIVGFGGGRAGEDALRGSPWVAAPAEALAEWRAKGADGVVVTARTTADVDALVHAAERW